jgi:hypothetical protein
MVKMPLLRLFAAARIIRRCYSFRSVKCVGWVDWVREV